MGEPITAFVGTCCVGCEARRREERTYYRAIGYAAWSDGAVDTFECVACNGIVDFGPARRGGVKTPKATHCRECKRQLIGQLGEVEVRTGGDD